MEIWRISDEISLPPQLAFPDGLGSEFWSTYFTRENWDFLFQHKDNPLGLQLDRLNHFLLFCERAHNVENVTPATDQELVTALGNLLQQLEEARILEIFEEYLRILWVYIPENSRRPGSDDNNSPASASATQKDDEDYQNDLAYWNALPEEEPRLPLEITGFEWANHYRPSTLERLQLCRGSLERLTGQDATNFLIFCYHHFFIANESRFASDVECDRMDFLADTSATIVRLKKSGRDVDGAYEDYLHLFNQAMQKEVAQFKPGPWQLPQVENEATFYTPENRGRLESFKDKANALAVASSEIGRHFLLFCYNSLEADLETKQDFIENPDQGKYSNLLATSFANYSHEFNKRRNLVNPDSPWPSLEGSLTEIYTWKNFDLLDGSPPESLTNEALQEDFLQFCIKYIPSPTGSNGFYTRRALSKHKDFFATALNKYLISFQAYCRQYSGERHPKEATGGHRTDGNAPSPESRVKERSAMEDLFASLPPIEFDDPSPSGIPQSLKGGKWSDFYTAENYHRLRKINPADLAGDDRESFIRHYLHANNGKSPYGTVEHFIASADIAAVLGDRLEPAYTSYLESFNVEIGKEFQLEFEGKKRQRGDHLKAIPENLQKLLWADFITVNRWERISQLEYRELHERRDLSKSKYHFLAYCHHRLQGQSGIPSSRQEFVTGLKDDPFTLKDTLNPFDPFQVALRDGDIQDFYEDYLTSFRDIAYRNQERLKQGKSLLRPEVNWLLKKCEPITADQVKILCDMVDTERMLPVRYKEALGYLDHLESEDSSLNRSIREVLADPHLYLPPALQWDARSSSLRSDERASLAELDDEQKKHFDKYCELQGEAASEPLFEKYRKAVFYTREARLYKKPLVKEMTRIYERYGENGKDLSKSILAEVAKDYETYKKVVQLMQLFKEHELTDQEMRYVAVRLGPKRPQ
ncbi:hypothetical protein [Streptomyces wuyuanensis]|uniref:hypothetical protein n=1 Tax=Streptomyces wuyuanensis TaxID=1196353 RepID=UPI00344A4040